MNLLLNNKQNNKKGFAMLFAILTASLLVTIGISIFSISLKELMISASIRDSQTAYYAARSAEECFKYWNYYDTGRAFNPLLGDGSLKEDDDITDIKCNGIPLSIPLTKNGYFYSYDSGTTPFFKYSTDGIKPEARFSYQIEAELTCDPSNPPPDTICPEEGGYTMHPVTTFRGYNTGSSGRRVERGYTITY